MNSNPDGYVQQVDEHPHDLDPQPQQPAIRPKEQEIPISKSKPDPKKKKEKRKANKVQNNDDSSSSDDDEEALELLKKGGKHRDNRKPSQKSLQLQQQELEESNKNALKWAIRLRSFSRIVFLIVVTTFLFTGFYLIFTFLAFYQGANPVHVDSNITLNITNCKLKIIDMAYSPLQNSQFKGAFLSSRHTLKSNVTKVPKVPTEIAVAPDMALVYTIPGRFNIDPSANVSHVETLISGQDYSYVFQNILSAESCEVDLHIYQKTRINKLEVNCQTSCFVMMLAQNISFQSVSFKGDLIEANIAHLETQNLSFDATQGRFQGGYVDFNIADVRLEQGDIILQSDKELMLNWTHATPNYCLGSPVIANPIVIGCQEPPQSEIDAFISGVGTGSKKPKKAVAKKDGKKGKDDGKDKGKDEGKGKDDGKDKGKDEGKHYEDDTEDDLLTYDEDEIELFFEPDQDTGTVILLPFMDTYQQSKEFQGQFLEEEPAKGDTPAKGTPKGTEPAKGNKTNDNMHSKTKASKAKEKALFLPSCYGSSIFCSTPNCTTLKEALSKLPNATAPTEAPKGRRNLEAAANATAPAANKTAPIDYKGLNAQAAKMLPHEIPKGVRFVNITGRFGNVYVNLIPGKEQVIDLNDTVIHGVSYASGAVKFDLPSQKILKDYKTQAKDPHNFDPTFILELGSKTTRSDNFQQWTVTYNPAYSYIRPWWIGTFSFTLMNTATWDLGLNLSPGFCPYVPELDLNDIHSTGFLIQEFFKDADNAITTIHWQNSIEFPKTTYSNTSNGVRQVIESNDEFEKWINVEKINETNYKLNIVNLDNSPATQWAAYISFVIAGLVAAIGIIGVVYVVNSVYSEIITQVASTNKYSTIEKKNDSGAVQPLMSQPPEKKAILKEGSDSEEEEEIVKKPKKETQSEEFEILLNFNPGRLFYQLFVLAPPLSAFIDYLCVLLSKKYINSAKEFYTHLFMVIEKPSSERQLHDLTTETILGNDMKTLYEKFCYLNGFLEQKLDDETNLKLLKEKGFKIETREDAQTESYVKVLLNGFMPKINVPKDTPVLDLFIKNCCKTSNFEEDNVVVSTFNESYQEFCTINHLEYQQASAAELQKKFNIISKYIPQQWVVRDEEAIPKVVDPENQTFYTKVQDSVNSCVAKCLPEKETFAIDRQKMQNHYSLIMNNPEKIKTTAELALANKELILFGGWWAVDFVTVIAHFITTIVLILPLFIFTILEKILYSPYSLIPRQFLITLEDVMFNYWILPLKLYHESNWIKNILILVGVYWVYSIIDLLYYYVSMEFPQENFFRKVSPKTTNRIQLLFRQIMWGLVLYSAYQFLVFASLAIVWLILGAIVNPTAFLPYATAAATFVAVVSGKAAQFKEIAQDGFQTVIDFVEKIAQQQMGSMITKFDLKGKVGAVMESSAFKNIAGQAASLGLVDQATLTHLEENAESMLANPEKALETAAGEISEIAANPGAFVAKMMKQMEEKAVSMIKEQLVKQVDEFGEQLADVVLAIFKKDKLMFKNNMAQLMYAAAKNPKLESLKKMSTPIMNLIWEFAYPNGTATQQAEDYIQQLLQPCTDCIAGLVAQELQQIDPALDFEQKTLSVALSKAISLEKNLQKNNMSGVFKDIEEIIQTFATEERFPQIKQLSQYGGLLKVAMSLFENKKGGQLSFHKIFNIISGFFDDIPQLKDLKDLLGIIELLINTFRKQQKQLPTKIIRVRIQKGLSFILNKIASLERHSVRPEDLAILKNSSLITLMFNFMQHHFDKIPKDQLKDIFKTLDKDCPQLGEIVKTEKEHKKLVKLMSLAFEFMALFMENNKELVTTLHNAANSFSIEEKKAEQIQMIASIKYLKQTTFDGSKQEDQLFDSLLKNGIMLNLQSILRIEMKVLQGIICQLLHLWSKQCVQEMYYFMSKINKVDLNRVRQFFSILILFKSKSESHLTNAAVNLCIPRDYIILILLSKQVLNLQFVDYDNLLRLGVSEEKLKDLFKETDLKVFLSKIKEDIIKQDDGQVIGGNSQSLKIFLIEGIATAGQITKKSLQDLLLALGNNQNEFAKLTQNDIDLLFNILQLKNIELSNANALTSDSKQGIYTFATMLNVSKEHLEDMINIVFLTNSDRVVQSIINTQKAETPYIELSSQKDYESYVEFMYSKLEMISKKHLFIQNKFKQLFPMINLPTSLIEKLLFNKDAQMDINSYYELAYQIIERDDNGKLPKGTLQQLNNSVSFITSTLNTTDLSGLRTSLNKNDLTDGQGFVLQMLNENSRKRSISIFMDYLLINSKRNKNDDTRPLPQVYHLFASLYLFFTGEQSELLVKYEEQGKPTVELTIVDYLAKKLDIKPEFFEALHTFYLKDNQKFTQVMIKFMRRQQACQFEADYPGVKIPLQSLVKIPDQFVLNFINLITRDNYQTSFFAKELGLDNDIVVFVNNLMQIQSAKTPVERRVQLQYLATNSQTVGPLLKSVSVQGDELKTLITLMFQDYQPNKIEWIINDLRLESKIKVNDLRVLLQLDNVIDLEDKNNFKNLQEQIQSNQLLEKMSLDKDIVLTAKGLCRGMFGSMDEYFKLLPHFWVNNEEYIETMSGLIGSISGVIPENFNVRSFLRDLYKQLLDPKKKDVPYFLQGSHTVQYAYYQLAKNIQVNPMILMLTQGILPAWKTLNDTYFNILNLENKFLNPIIVLQTILSFTAMPTLVKEIYTEQEWYQQHGQYLGQDFQSDEFQNQREQLRDITDVLFAEQLETKQQMMDFADSCGIDRKITNYVFADDEGDVKSVLLNVLSESVQLLGQDEENPELIDLAAHIKSMQETEPETTFEQAIDTFVTNLDDQERLKKYKAKVHQRTVIKCYQELEKLFIDPRFLNKVYEQGDYPMYAMQYQQSHDTIYYNMGVCTTLASLKRIYWQQFENVTPRDDEHSKIVTHQIDYILTSIERLYYFKNCFDYFAKPRAIQLIGLATGFVLTAEHMIYANCTASFSTIEKATEFYEMSKDTDRYTEIGDKREARIMEDKVDMKWDFIAQIFVEREEHTHRDFKFFKDYKYEAIKRLGPDIITEPENYINGAIQMTGQMPQDNQGFNWEDYFYDIAFLQKGGDLIKWCRFKGSNKFEGQNFSNENREKIMQLQCKELFQQQMERQFKVDEKDYEDKLKSIDVKTNKLVPQQSVHQPIKKEATLENCVDPRTDQLFSDIVKSQNKFAEVIQTQTENFQLVVDIFKGNYQSIIEPDTYFTDEEPQAAPIYYGLVALSGSYFKVQNGWNQNTSNDLSRYLNSCCWNTPSNKKNMQEVLSVYFRCFDSFTALASVKSQDIKLLNSFIQLSCGLSQDQQLDQLGTLINAMSLSQNDADVFITLIQTYLGEVDQYYKLAEYSSFIKPPALAKFRPIQMANMIKNKRQKGAIPVQQNQGAQPVQNVAPDGAEQQPAVPAQSVPGSPKMNPKDNKKDPKKDAKKDPKKDAKKDGKDKPAEGDKPKKKEIKIIKKVKKQETGIQSSGDMYFSVKKILNKLLYGFDQSELHNKAKIDWNSFDFQTVSALSLDPDKTEEAFTLLLWQLAQAVTKDTITDQLKLPILSESDAAQKDDEFTKVYWQNKGPIQQVQDLIITLLKDDYSFFFKQAEDIKPILASLKIISDTKQDEDLSFLKAMIGLKSNKIQAMLTKKKSKGVQSQQIPLKLDIDDQVKNLVESKIIDIRVDGQSKEKNEQISKDIALLFLAISSGNINKIVEALINRDGMSACFVLTLYLWKNFTTILMNPKLYSEEYQTQIFPAIQLLPLLIFSQMNEQQDLMKGVPRNNKRSQVLESLGKIVQFVKEYKPNQDYYQDIDKLSQRFHKKKQQFQWSLWISLQPNFVAAIKTFNQSSTLINGNQMSNALQTNIQCEYLFRLLTGYTIVEKVQGVRFLGNIIKLYLDCNKIINFPHMVEVKNMNFKTIIPQSISTLMDILPDGLKTYAGVFDKFVQLFIFIQIPSSSMKSFHDRQTKSAQQEEEEDYDDDDDNDGYEDGEEEEAEGGEEEVEDENVVAGPSSEGEKIIIGLVLDVLQQTVNGLWMSFKKDNQLALAQKVDNLSKEIKNKEELMAIQQKQQEKQQQIMQSTIFQSQIGQQLGQQTQPMQQPLGGSSPGLLPQFVQGVVQGQFAQMPLKPPPPPPPGKNQQAPVVYDLVGNKAKLADYQSQLKTIDSSSMEVKKLINGVIILLTGYNIEDKQASANKDQKVQILCYIVDSTLFKNLKLLQFINTQVIRDLYRAIDTITQQPIKQISNSDFMKSILQLLYIITGQPAPDDLKVQELPSGNKQQLIGKQYWQVDLPKRKLIVELPMPVIRFVFDLTTGKIESISEFLKELKVGDGAIKIVDNIIQQVQAMGVFGGQKAIAAPQTGKDSKKAAQIQELMKKIEDGTASATDMFKAIDEDGSNSISKDEYGVLARRLGMNLSEHRINEIFASIKQGKSGKDESLNEQEFQKAMSYLQSKNTNMALDFLGISPALLTMSLIMLAIILMLLFVFIFLGIQAFALGGTFGAVVNSILPMAAGGGAGSKAEKLGDKNKRDSPIGDAVEKTQKIIQSDKI